MVGTQMKGILFWKGNSILGRQALQFRQELKNLLCKIFKDLKKKVYNVFPEQLTQGQPQSALKFSKFTRLLQTSEKQTSIWMSRFLNSTRKTDFSI